MSLSKKKCVEEGKKRIQEKLSCAKDQKNEILSILEDITEKACKPAEDLMQETSKKGFMHKFKPVMTDLETCLNTLFLIKASLSDITGSTNSDSSSTDSEDEDDDKPKDTRIKGTASKTQIYKSKDTDKNTAKESVDTKTENVPTGRQGSSQCDSVDSARQKDDVVSSSKFIEVEHSGVKIKVEKKQNQSGSSVVKEQTDSIDSSAKITAEKLSSQGRTEVKSDVVETKIKTEPTKNVDENVSSVKRDTGKQFADTRNVSSRSVNVPPESVAQTKSEDVVTEQTKVAPTKTEPAAEEKVTPDQSTVGMCKSVESATDGAKVHHRTTRIIPNIPATEHGSVPSSQIDDTESCISEMTVSSRAYGVGPVISAMKIETTFEGIVTEVINPSMFWVQPFSPELDELMENINNDQQQLLPEDPGFKLGVKPRPGMSVLSCFTRDNSWYRAKIIAVKPRAPSTPKNRAKADVLYIDYGNRECVTVDRLRKMDKKYATLPACAFPCSLNQVAPMVDNRGWDPEECWKFAEQVLNKESIHITVSGIPQCPIYFSELFFAEEPLPGYPSGSSVQASVLTSLSNTMVNSMDAKPVANQYVYDKTIKPYLESIPKQKNALSERDILSKQTPNFVSSPTKSASDIQIATTKQVAEASALSSTRKSDTDHPPTSAQELTKMLKADLAATQKPPGMMSSKKDSFKDVAKSETLYGGWEDASKKSSQNQESRGIDNPEVKSRNTKVKSSKNDKGASSGSGKSRSSDNINANIDNLSPRGSPTSDREMKLTGDSTTSDKYETDMIVTNRAPTPKSDKLTEQSPVHKDTGSPSQGGDNVSVPSRSQTPSSEHVVTEKGDSITNLYEQIYKGATDNQSSEVIDKTDTGSSETTGKVFDVDSFEYSPQTLPVPEDGCLSFMMSNIVSPSEFWIHIVNKDSAEVLDHLMEDLNSFYKTANQLMLKKFLQNKEPKPGYACCAKFSEDKRYYRAEVVDVKISTPQRKTRNKGKRNSSQTEKPSALLKVLYVDYGNSEWLQPKHVLPLPPRFAEVPPQAISCRLASLYPAGAEEGTTDGALSNWSPGSVDKMIELTGFEKVLHGYVIRADVAGKTITLDRQQPLDMLVIDTAGESDVWLNEELMRLGMAVCPATHVIPAEQNKYNTKKVDPKASDAEIANWNPMAEDFLSERNSYMIDTDDADVAITGRKDEQKFCKFFGRPGGGCWRGDLCQWRHVDPKLQGSILDQRPVYCLYDSECVVQTPEEGSWVAVEVTAIHNPAHFYVTFPYGPKAVQDLMKEDGSMTVDEGYPDSMSHIAESMDNLMEAMNDHYSKQVYRDTDLVVYAPGELIAAQFSQNQKWYRSRVVESDPDQKRVKVFYVDIGNSEWVPEEKVYQMQNQFLHLPFQAVECFLPLNSVKAKWDKKARSSFLELVNGKILFAHILTRSPNGVICVDLFDTEEKEVDICQVLVDQGHATRPVVDTQKKTKTNASSASSTNYIPG